MSRYLYLVTLPNIFRATKKKVNGLWYDEVVYVEFNFGMTLIK